MDGKIKLIILIQMAMMDMLKAMILSTITLSITTTHSITISAIRLTSGTHTPRKRSEPKKNMNLNLPEQKYEIFYYLLAYKTKNIYTCEFWMKY